jgi:Fic family protein
MSDLERFLQADNDGLPVLIRTGMAHLQFETIHPFLDGNGRVGRLLITLLLCHAGVVREPLLYLSLYLKQHRSMYYELLDRVRRDGDWEAWLRFFLEGVRLTADGAVVSARALQDLLARDQGRAASMGRVSGSTLRAHRVFAARPIGTIKEVQRRSGLSHPAASSATMRLVELGVLTELTGRRRDRVFAYREYLEILDRGAGE